MDQDNIRQRYMEAVDSFVGKIRDDQNVIAVILCGSLSYDKVWVKSDVDMTVVVRDQKLINNSYCIIEDDIVINVNLVQRSDFKRSVEKTLGGSMMHSYYNKGRIVYTADESLYGYFEEMKKLGGKDLELTKFFHASSIIYYLEKSEKWLIVKNDPLYSQYYIAMAANEIASMTVLKHGEIPTREAVLRAREFEPELMKYFYDDAMAFHWSRERIEEAIRKLDRYLESLIPDFSGPAVEFLSDGEMRTVSELVERFKSQPHFIVGIFNYLSEKGKLVKASKTIRITPKSRMAVEEAAYIYMGESGFPDGGG